MAKENFPHYLGYGLAKKESYRTEGNEEIMDYYLDDVKVHEARVSPDRAYFIDFVNNQRGSFSTYPTLKQAVFSHYALKDQSQTAIHELHNNKVCSAGNVYVAYLNKSNNATLFYPAVFMVSLKIPVTAKNRVAADLLKEQHLTKTLEKTEYSSSLTITGTDGVVRLEDITILDISFPLSFSYWVVMEADMCQAILPDKLHRAILLPRAFSNGTSMQIFRGMDGDHWEEYNILYEN